MAFTATARPMKRMFYTFIISFFFATDIYGTTILLTRESGARSVFSLLEEFKGKQRFR